MFSVFQNFSKKSKEAKKKLVRDMLILGSALSALFVAFLFLWIATLELPDLSNFTERKIGNSTKIYDRTGKVLLFNIHENIKRTEIPLSEMSDYVKKAHIAIEDAEFYSHFGVRIDSTLYAILRNLIPGGGSPGGSTITQQVVKNALLTKEKRLGRKIKEWILAVKLEKELTKDEILEVYLNESPYGGSVYGVEEAALMFFGKSSKEVTLAEAAYLASLPQMPSYYSPYGSHLAELEIRKNYVLQRMYEVGFIGDEEYESARNEKVTFQSKESGSGKALHFVFYIREYLEERFGEDIVENGGLTIITSLDYELQKKLEETLKTYVLEHEKDFSMSNAALVAVDPKTGQILSMVGSRDYFDETIDGKVNITTRGRQPGSSFKPIVYAEAFRKGYTPETVVFDVPTEFSVYCDEEGKPLEGEDPERCYMPNNYDEIFRGPVSLRNALAQSLNVPAVKVLYLAGLDDSITLAQSLGVRKIGDRERYGLTLVLGGGEVSLLDLTSAYGVFANEGVRNQTTGILEVKDGAGVTLEKFTKEEVPVLEAQVARLVSSVLSDNEARTPAFGASSPLYFEGRDVAVKTGTTQNYRDVWVVGYTPSLALGVWGGNNNNDPIIRRTSSYILAPLWRKAMDIALENADVESFTDPEPTQENIKPVLRGIWCTQGENNQNSVHTILKYVVKDNPRGDLPQNPEQDSQYSHWEIPIVKWWEKNQSACIGTPTQNTNSGLYNAVGRPTSD